MAVRVRVGVAGRVVGAVLRRRARPLGCGVAAAETHAVGVRVTVAVRVERLCADTEAVRVASPSALRGVPSAGRCARNRSRVRVRVGVRVMLGFQGVVGGGV